MSSFPAGSQVRVAELGDCENCEVMRAQPSDDNEIILDAYVSLPANYDGWSGNKVIRYDEVIQVFEMLRMSPERYDDYYKRLMFFHERLITARAKEQEKRAQNNKAPSDEGTGSGTGIPG